MEKDTGELLIVLEEQRKPLDRLLSSNREFRRKFTSRLEVPIFINDELLLSDRHMHRKTDIALMRWESWLFTAGSIRFREKTMRLQLRGKRNNG